MKYSPPLVEAYYSRNWLGVRLLSCGERIRVEIIHSVEEYTSLLEVVVGLVIDRANLRWHKKTIKSLAKLDMEDIELKKI